MQKSEKKQKIEIMFDNAFYDKQRWGQSHLSWLNYIYNILYTVLNPNGYLVCPFQAIINLYTVSYKQ